MNFINEIENKTREIGKREKALKHRYADINEMDSLIRDSALISDILTQMIHALKKYETHQLKGRFEDCEAIKNRMHKKIDIVRENYLINYKSLLNARRNAALNRSLIELDEKRRQELYNAFENKVVDKLTTFRDEVEAIDSLTNLKALKQQLRERNKNAQKTCEELHEKKTALTSETLNLDIEYQAFVDKLHSHKADLLEDLKNPNYK